MRITESIRHAMRAYAAYSSRADAFVAPGGSQWQRSRTYWDTYARYWSPEVESDDAGKQTGNERLGDEWGNKTAVAQVVTDFIAPYIGRDTIAGELGSGGGRMSLHVAPRVAKLHCFDISRLMLKRARAALDSYGNVEYHYITQPTFGPANCAHFDFFYTFDVLVHVPVHTIWRYFSEIARTLKPGAHAFLHTTNLASDAGWLNFCTQRGDHPYDHQFLSPEMVQIFADRAGLRIVKESRADPANFYYSRDYLFVVQKPVVR